VSVEHPPAAPASPRRAARLDAAAVDIGAWRRADAPTRRGDGTTSDGDDDDRVDQYDYGADEDGADHGGDSNDESGHHHDRC